MLPAVAFLGSSTIHGKGQAYDVIGDLRARPANVGRRLPNFGHGGDLAYNSLQRLPEVIRTNPAGVVVLVGGNDVLFSTFPKLRRFLALVKRPPREPAPDWFEQCVRDIVRQLKAGTTAAIALCSLGPIGEAPTSVDPVQRELNRLVAAYSSVVERVAGEEGATYIPFFEHLRDQIALSPGPALSEIKILSMYADAFRTVVLREDLDELGRRRGWSFHTDGIHLNRRGGKILADLIQGFLAPSRPRS